MQVARLKRWHWMLIGVAAGLLIGTIRGVIFSDLGNMSINGEISHEAFVRALRRPVPGTDRLQMKDIVVYRGKLPREAGAVDTYVAVLNYCTPDSQQARGGKIRPADAKYFPHAYCPDDVELQKSLAQLKGKGATMEQAGGFSRFVRKICEGLRIKPPDPPGSLLDYLRLATDYKGRHVDFTYAWWNQPRVLMIGWTLAGFVLIGLIWPTVINLIAFGSVVRPKEKEERGVSLAKVRSRPQPAKMPTSGVTQKDMDELRTLEAELEKKLKASGMEITTGASSSAAEPAAPVRQLTATESEVAHVPEKAQEDKQFNRKEGDFYPVERHAKKDEE